MKLYIIAGEASGDLHGSNLLKELNKQKSGLELRGFGGDLMQAEGLVLSKHYRELAFMGFVEVLLNIRAIFKNIAFCKQDILAFKPDAIILIDYPGFNLKIAQFAKKNGIKVFYYISPKVWAWKEGRVKKIKENVDKLFTIFPFETNFFKKHNLEVSYVGNPLLDAIQNYTESNPSDFKEKYSVSKPILALLPGSRTQEIDRMLPLMLKVASKHPNHKIVVAGAPSKNKLFYEKYLHQFPAVKLVFDETYNILSSAEVALVTSGTATLETALFNVPQVVCYKANALTYQIAKRLVKLDYISLVNLILDKEAVMELIQDKFNEVVLNKELIEILPKGSKRKNILEDYKILRKTLGDGGASQKVAGLMLKTLSSQ